MLSIHYGGACVAVRDIVCRVPVKSRQSKRQPHIVMTGRGIVRIVDGVAHITKGEE